MEGCHDNKRRGPLIEGGRGGLRRGLRAGGLQNIQLQSPATPALAR
jgi:hypothetical protein